MATVLKFMEPSRDVYYIELKKRADRDETESLRRFVAAKLLQRVARGHLIRKWVAWLNHNATIIQCAFRCHLARKAYRLALKRAVQSKIYKHYNKCITKIQSVWRGYLSRRHKFCYVSYRRWLKTITERGERRKAEAAEYRKNSRVDDLKILEEEAKRWLAFVVFKLHHLLRTYAVSGVFSDKGTHELSEFEKLIKSIKYADYMQRLRHKYSEFVRKHKPKFSNKRLFPIIGEGKDYWYLSLPEMYEMTKELPKQRESGRHKATHHGLQHKEPFLWRNPKHNSFDDRSRGPFTPKMLMCKRCKCLKCPCPPAPAPTPNPGGDATLPKDPRFDVYVKHYKPAPDLLEYVDFHVNAFLKRENSIKNFDDSHPHPRTAVTNDLIQYTENIKEFDDYYRNPLQ